MSRQQAQDHAEHVVEQWRRERADLDASPILVIGRLHRVALALTAELVRVYAAHGLGEGDFDVLATLRRAGAPYERTPGELAEHTMVTTGAMTKRIDRLEGAGLVSRRTSDRDGRGRVIALTAAGLELIDAAFTDHMANEHRLLGQLTPPEADQLAALLTAWLARYE
jgi:DNA-binding MarR family transcriptional regulator